MPGAIPTGPDPDYIDPWDGSIIGAFLSNLIHRDRETIEAQEKARLRSGTHKTMSDAVFEGITPTLGIVGGIIKAVLQKVIGIPLSIVEGGLEALFNGFRGIPVSMLVDESTENLLLNPQFLNSLTGWFQQGNAFQLDLTQGHDVDGSVRVTADGVKHELVSENIPVREGQSVMASVWRKVANGVGVASPVRLELDGLDSDGIVKDVYTFGATPGNGNLDWSKITGPNYVVPAGVVAVRLRLVVTATMTSGYVWFDDAELKKSGKIPQNFIAGLVELLEDIPLIGDLVKAFTGTAGTLLDLAHWVGTSVAKLIGGRLAPGQEPQSLLDLGQSIINVIDAVNPLDGLDGIIQGVYDVIQGIFIRGVDNSKRIADIEAYVKGINVIKEDFEGPTETPPNGWTILKYGPSTAGSLQQANGVLRWKSGITATNQVDIGIRSGDGERIGSPHQYTTYLLRKKIRIEGNGALVIPLRANFTTDKAQWDCQFIRLDGGEIVFGMVINGVVYDFNSGHSSDVAPISYTQGNQDRIDWQLGDGDSNPWFMRVWINGTEMTKPGGVTFDCTTVNAGASVLLDSDHDWPAVGMYAYGIFIPPFPPGQIPPAEVDEIRWQQVVPED